MVKAQIILLFLFILHLGLFAQKDNKLIFEGDDDSWILDMTEHNPGEFAILKNSRPLNNFINKTSKIYTLYSDSGDTIQWDLELFRQDTVLTISKLRTYFDQGYLIIGTGSVYADSIGTEITERFTWAMRLDNMKNVVWEKFFPYPEGVSNLGMVAMSEVLFTESWDIIVAQTIKDFYGAILSNIIYEISSQGLLKRVGLLDQSIAGNVLSLVYNYDSSEIILAKTRTYEPYCHNGIDEGAVLLDTANFDTIGGMCFKINGSGFKDPFDLKLLPNGELIVAGTYWQTTNKVLWYFGVEKYDTSYQSISNILLTNPDTVNYAAWSNSLDINESGEIFIAGTYDDIQSIYTSHVNYIYIAKLDSDLQLIKERYLGHDAEYRVFTMQSTSDGGILVGGSQYNYLVNEEYESDAFVYKLDEGIWLDVPQIGESGVLRAIVYPNPGSDHLYVRTTISNAIFELYCTTGQLWISEPLTNLATMIDTSELPPGAYLWRVIKDSNICESGKWIKIN